MRLLLTALTCQKGQVQANLERHLALLDEGHAAQCDLVLLPEMSLTGYRRSAALSLEHPAVRRLVSATQGAPHLSFGLVETSATDAADPRPFITQVLAGSGRVLGVHRKAGLASDELADFRRGHGSGPITLRSSTLSTAVCAEMGTEPPYGQGSDLVLGPAAPGLYGPRRVSETDWRRGYEWWRESVLADATRLLGPGSHLAVSTQAGATDDEDFPGWAALVDSAGTVLAELPDGSEGTLVVQLPRHNDHPMATSSP